MLVEVARAEGSFFYTPDGKRYYDLVAGVSVSNVGHCNPDVVRAVQEQAARYMHVMVYGEMVESPQVTYAARIAAALPAPLDSVYFVNSGAEAVEGALKLAKRVTGRTELVSMRRAYHGSTHGAMSMMELFKEAGILSDWFLYCDTAFRISPPLTISEEEVRDSARIVAECLDKL